VITSEKLRKVSGLPSTVIVCIPNGTTVKISS